MADAKIITFGELFSATTDVIPDNKAAAVEIEGLDGNDYIKINTTDGYESVRLVSSGTGNAGVGAWTEDYLVPGSDPEEYTDPPPYPFAIHGTGSEVGGDILEVRSTGTDRAGGIAIRSDDGDPRIRFQVVEGATKWVMGSDEDDSYVFKIDQHNAVGSNTKLEIDLAGNVTIPGGDFHVTNGDVGIGTAEPAAMLHMQKDAGGAAIVMQSYDGSFGVDEIYGKIDFGNRNFDDRICSIVAAQEAACDSAATANGYLAFYTEASGGAFGERMRIDSNGGVLIGADAHGASPSTVTIQTNETDGNALGILARSDDIGEINFYEYDKTTKLGEIQYRATLVNIRHRVGDVIFCAGGVAESMKIAADGNVTMNAGLSIANTSTPGTKSVAIGDQSTATGDYSSTIGQQSTATGDRSHSMGRMCHASGDYSACVGMGSTADGDKSQVLGFDSTAGHLGSTALGYNVRTTANYTIARNGTIYGGRGCAQTTHAFAQVQTTDDTLTYLDDTAGTADFELFSTSGFDNSQVVKVKVVLMSTCTTASGTYLRNDFVSREYNFAIQYTHVSSLGRLNSDAIITKVTLATPADITNFDDGMEVTFSSGSDGTGTPVTTTISSTDKDPASGDYGTFNVASTTGIEPQDYCTVAPVAGFIGASNAAFSTGDSVNAYRENEFTDNDAAIGHASAGTGIDDKIYFATSTNKVGIKFAVTGGEAGATLRHVAHITAHSMTMA